MALPVKATVTLLGIGDSFKLTPSLLFSLERKSYISTTEDQILQRCLVNAPEELQRLCVEHRIKTSMISTVLLTSSAYTSAQGLAGLHFALSDVGGAEMKIRGPRGTSEFVNI